MVGFRCMGVWHGYVIYGICMVYGVQQKPGLHASDYDDLPGSSAQLTLMSFVLFSLWLGFLPSSILDFCERIYTTELVITYYTLELGRVVICVVYISKQTKL